MNEDLQILNFVMKNGTKWSRLTKILCNRTEHNLKNRFFSLLSIYFDMTIKKVKILINYRETQLLQKIIDEKLSVKLKIEEKEEKS